MKRLQRIMLILGSLAAILTVGGFFLDPRDFYRSYLYAFLFVVGLSLGALANLMLHTVTGGHWGLPLRRPLMAAVRITPLSLLLFIPIAFGLAALGIHPTDTGLKHYWFQPTFFLLRAAIYFAIWISLAWRWISIATRSDDVRPVSLRRLSAGGLIAYGITVSLAAIDWIMALLPQWYSTAFGLLIGVAQMLSAMALGVLACAFMQDRERRDTTPFNDLGNLLLMYVMSWAYIAYTQFLIIWAEDLPREISWYLPRMQSSWRWLSIALILLQFAIPFALLLSRAMKRTPKYIGPLAAALLVAQLLYTFYLVTPTLQPHGFYVSWSDLVAVIAVLGLWCAAWLSRFQKTPAMTWHT
jgi:hypothetical protein